MATAALQIPSTVSISCIPQEFLYSSYSSSNLCLNTEKKIQKSSLEVTSNLIFPSSSKSFPSSIDYGKTDCPAVRVGAQTLELPKFSVTLSQSPSDHLFHSSLFSPSVLHKPQPVPNCSSQGTDSTFPSQEALTRNKMSLFSLAYFQAGKNRAVTLP